MTLTPPKLRLQDGASDAPRADKRAGRSAPSGGHRSRSPTGYGHRMSRRRGLLSAPRDYLAAGATWPDGPLLSEAPPEAHLLQAISTRLRDKTSDRSTNEIARQCNLATQTVSNILNGDTWAEAPSIARLEYHLNIELWGKEHKDQHAILARKSARPRGRRRL